MILDQLSSLALYNPLHPLFAAVADYLSKTDLSNLPVGKHELPQGVVAIVSHYQSKPLSEGFIECHRRNIDIQVLTKGRELVGICHRDLCQAQAYDDKKDFQVLEGKTEFFTLNAGQFAIFFPHDGHMPQLQVDGQSEEVHKVVFKVPVLKQD